MAVINQSNVRLPSRYSRIYIYENLYVSLSDTFFKHIKCSFWPIRGLVLVNFQVALMALVQSHCFLWLLIKHFA